jgi:hypothetical protein
MSYTIKYNGSTSHLAGIDERTQGSEFNYAVSACSALSRSARFCNGKSFDDLSEALKGLRSNAAAGRRKVCKNCESAAEAAIADN